jgi:hypothetical protein
MATPTGSPRDELRLIHETIRLNRRLVVGTWRHQLSWAVLITAGLVATWWGWRRESSDLIGLFWLVLVATGWTLSWLLERGAPAPLRNPVTRSFAGIWIGIGGALSILGLVGVGTGGLPATVFPGVHAALMGAGCFAAGRATEMAWLGRAGWAWWVAAVVVLLGPGAWSYLATAGLTLVVHGGGALRLARLEVGRPRLVQEGAAP